MKNSSRPLGAFLALVFISLPILAFLSFFIAPETVSKRYGFLFSVLDLVFYLILVFLSFAFVAYVLVSIFRKRPFKSASSIRLEFGADSKPDFALLEIKNLSERDEYIESAGFVEELWRRVKVAGKTQSHFVTLACPSPSASLHNNFPLKICAKESVLIRLNFRELAADHSLCGIYCDVKKDEVDSPKGAFFRFVNSCGSDLYPAGKIRTGRFFSPRGHSRLMKRYSKKIPSFRHILIAFLLFVAFLGLFIALKN